ncbi:MAG: hypothetical protein QGG36_05320 [Pirellulaceae bacterium]|jgi:tetratricopeptide (TPR) repeat protein|nr:hypothetical protein [Pirellulaceae bacterium]MDP7015194.1 hypothetical protein [Pirellulaceae bacterium]
MSNFDSIHRVLAPEQRRRLQDVFERGRRRVAEQSRQYPAIHACFAECVAEDPANSIYLEAMLQNLIAWRLEAPITNPLRRWSRAYRAFRKSCRDEQWLELLKIAPSTLASSPFALDVLLPLAAACRAVGLFDIELRYLLHALPAHPADTETNRRCGEALAYRGLFFESLDCWRNIADSRPRDARAKQLTAILSEYVDPAEPANPDPSETDVDELLGQAEQLAAAGKFVAANELITRCQSIAPGEHRAVAAGESLEIRRKRRQIETAQALRDAMPDAERIDRLVDELTADVRRLEVDRATAAAARFPNDGRAQLALAIAFRDAGQFAAAQRQFELLMSATEEFIDPPLPARVKVEFAECRQLQQRFSEALALYEDVAQSEEPEFGGRAHYWAGRLAEGLAGPAAARRHYRLAVSLGGYKDAAERLDKLAAIGDKD